MSDISIVRWFLGLTLEEDSPRYFSNDNNKSIVIKYQRMYEINALSTISNNIHRQIMEYRFDNHLKNHIVGFYTGKYLWKIIKIPESCKFIDYDDTSLVLTCGRDIVDENFIKGLTDNSFKIDLDTFKSIIESNPYE